MDFERKPDRMEDDTRLIVLIIICSLSLADSTFKFWCDTEGDFPCKLALHFLKPNGLTES